MTALCYPRDVKPRRLLISGGADCTIRVWDLMYAFSSSCFLHFSKYFGVSFLCVCFILEYNNQSACQSECECESICMR